MNRKSLNIILLAAALGGSLWLGTLAGRPTAQAQAPAKPITGPLADLLSGKLYPSTLERDQLGPTYHYVSLVDAQGKAATCATRGETLIFGGETFLVTYLLPPSPPRAAGADATSAPDAQLTLVNMRDIQAFSNIRDTPPPAPTVPATPAPAPAPLGTAAP